MIVKYRYIFLTLLLLLRFIIGLVLTNKYEDREVIKLTGNVDKIYQRDNKCIIDVGQFIAFDEGKCELRVGDKVLLVGKVRKQALTNWQGKIVLEIERIKLFRKNKGDEKVGFFGNSYLGYLRNYCREVWGKLMPKKEAGLVAGIVLGDKTDIGYDFYQQMVRSGSIHIVVASGYNVLLVGGVVLSIMFWFGKRSRAIWVAIAVMIFYAVLAGGEPPVIRAVLMAGLLYISQAMGRKTNSIWILFLSIWLMLIWEPAMLSSISFQLSVAASMGLMILAPWVINRYSLEQVEKLGLVSTASTMLLTAPILWWNFGRFSLIGLVSNVLILPLVPPLMLLGVGMLVLPGFLYLPTYALAHLLVRLIEFFGTI